MHVSWISVCFNHDIASLMTVSSKHHGEFGTRTFTLNNQISGPSAHGSGLVTNNFGILDNGVSDLDFVLDQVVSQGQEKASI